MNGSQWAGRPPLHIQPRFECLTGLALRENLLGRIAITARPLLKTSFKGASKTRCMLVAHRARDFLDAEAGGGQQRGGLLQPLLGEQVAESQSSSSFEEMLQMRLAEVKSHGPVLNLAERIRVNELQQFVEPYILEVGIDQPVFQRGCSAVGDPVLNSIRYSVSGGVSSGTRTKRRHAAS